MEKVLSTSWRFTNHFYEFEAVFSKVVMHMVLP